jgi:hypothetical protein
VAESFLDTGSKPAPPSAVIFCLAKIHHRIQWWSAVKQLMPDKLQAMAQ